MRIGTNIIVAALHEPVRLAEDATAMSLLTGDRFELGVGLGYRATGVRGLRAHDQATARASSRTASR